jgi:hypothetical protein
MAGRYPRVGGAIFPFVFQEITPGNVFWVDSGTGSDDNRGDDPGRPFATIDYAIGQCTASNGDVIYVFPGHAENVASASAITVDIAGITIIGLGNGTNRPTLTYTATTSTVVVSAANCKIANIRFVSGINDLAVFLTLGANNATVENCDFITASTYEAFNFIGITTTYDYATIRGCRFIQPTDPEGTDAAAGTGAIYLVDSEYVTVEDCQFVGYFETAIIHNKTTAAGQLWIRRCYGYQKLAAKIGLLVEGCTGGDIGSLYINPNATDVTTAQLFGTESTTFFIASYFGNDSGGGQGAVFVTAAT